MRDIKISYTGTILSISQAQIKIKQQKLHNIKNKDYHRFLLCDKRSHASYESIILEPDIIMKLGWLQFKAGKEYRPAMCISLG